MLKVLSFCLTLSFYIFQVKSQYDVGYTWEDYKGQIPPNAIEASDDPTNPVYVGMATVNGNDCPGTLLPGATEITVQCFGIHKVKEGLKILTVEDKTIFKWIPTKKGSFWIDLYSFGRNPVSVYSLSNEWRLGRITTDKGTIEVGHTAQGVLHFVQDNRHKQKDRDYQVLTNVKNEQQTPAEPTPADKDVVDESKIAGNIALDANTAL